MSEYHCKRCDSTDIREYHGDVVNVSGPGDGLVYFSYAACADCGLHADYEEWLDSVPEEESKDE